MTTSPGEFFNTGGGNLNAEAPSYVSRKADDELYDGLSQGEYCYVLTSRQTGKSSLAIRIAERLRAVGTAVTQLDLTTLGHTLNPEQWYYGLLFFLGERLDLMGELRSSGSPTKTWVRSRGGCRRSTTLFWNGVPAPWSSSSTRSTTCGGCRSPPMSSSRPSSRASTAAPTTPRCAGCRSACWGRSPLRS